MFEKRSEKWKLKKENNGKKNLQKYVLPSRGVAAKTQVLLREILITLEEIRDSKTVYARTFLHLLP